MPLPTDSTGVRARGSGSPEGSPPVAAAGEGSPDQCQSVGLAVVSTLGGSSTDHGDRNSGGDGDGTGEIGRRCGAARKERKRERGNWSVVVIPLFEIDE
mgnify:CR=1 FL=1